MSFTPVPSNTIRINRSQLFVPGSKPDLFEKASASNADIICLDLEDAVAPQDKEQAKENVIEALNNHDFGKKSIKMIQPSPYLTGWLDPFLKDPKFKESEGRSKNRDALNGLINDRIRQKASQYWVDLLNTDEVGVPGGPIYAVDQVFADPQVEHLKMAKTQHHPTMGDIKLGGQAINLTNTPAPEEFRIPVPELGEHTKPSMSARASCASTIGFASALPGSSNKFQP